jgi:predicted glycoside hydrolase/deacetylase ChbG (UPF0249 family)
MRTVRGHRALFVVADDYGYADRYDAGILEAIRAGAVDAVSVLVGREIDPRPLLETAGESGVDLGLHLALDQARPARTQLDEQLEEFERVFGRPADYLDGHKHCHSAPQVAEAIADRAAVIGLAVRSVDSPHRRLLRVRGITTPDLLVGRTSEDEPVIPSEIAAILDGDRTRGVIEWMTHPGRSGGPSSYDAGREEDLEALIRLGGRSRWAKRGVTRVAPSTLRA